MTNNLNIEKVTATEFKKQYKGFLKLKKQPQIVQIAQVSDFTSHTKVVQVIEELKQDILIITSRNKTIGYAVKSLDILKHDQSKQLFSYAHGALNFVSGINNKQVVFTFKTLPVREVDNVVFEAWERVNLFLDYKHEEQKNVNDYVVSVLGCAITKEIMDKATEIYKSNSALVESMRTKESDYRNIFEKFIEDFGFNCFDYQLVLKM